MIMMLYLLAHCCFEFLAILIEMCFLAFLLLQYFLRFIGIFYLKLNPFPAICVDIFIARIVNVFN